MEKILYFDYAAMVMDIVLLGCMLLRKMINGKLNRMFIILVTVALFTTAMDIIAVSYDRSAAPFIAEKYVYHSIYLMLRAFTSFFCLSYIIILTDTWFKASDSLIKKVILFLPVLSVVVLMIANLSTHNIFYISESGEYVRGDLFLLLYAINGYYVIYGFIKVFQNRKMLEPTKIFSIYAGTMFMIVVSMVQFIYPRALLDMFANSTGLLFLFMMVQRPEEITDSETGLIKLSTYDSEITRSFANNKPETIIMIKMVNYSSIRHMLGYRDTVNVKKIIADFMNRTMKEKKARGDVYYTESGNYRIKLEGKNRIKADEIAEQINEKFKEPLKYNEMQLDLVICVCIANIPDDIDNQDALVALGGDLKNQYTGNVLYAAQINSKERYSVMRDMDTILENAIANDEFEVYYQPIYSVHECRFNSAEALLRLKTERYGFIPPSLFIPAAEKNGAIHRIGQMVMEKVCEFISSDQYSELKLDYIEINLSPTQCMENNLASNMISIMEKNHVQPDQVNLELTESAAGDIQNTILENITALHKAGISFSLDDFGTGYSNMTRIAALPFCIIKLDKTFTNVEGNPNMIIVLENVIKMIKALNMKIVVEGIETKELVEKFKELDCEYIQGCYYSRPLPQREFVQFIKAHNNDLKSNGRMKDFDKI